jgi:hypothetical protein
LADAGARVIKIERPEGDFARGYDDVAAGESSYFVWLNRGKESVTLDLSAPNDRAVRIGQGAWRPRVSFWRLARAGQDGLSTRPGFRRIDDLGYFDHETCRLEPIENPFGPKVLPMSPE